MLIDDGLELTVVGIANDFASYKTPVSRSITASCVLDIFITYTVRWSKRHVPVTSILRLAVECVDLD